MSGSPTVVWFARHEGRLAWRDWLWLLSSRRRRRRRLVLGVFALALIMHVFAWLVVHRHADLSRPPDERMLVGLTGAVMLYGSLMLAQAIEAVTRVFYTRGDLDLILSSPAAAARLFAVRIAAVAATTAAASLALAAPFIDMLAWAGGWRWLAAYGVVAALAMAATAVAVAFTAGLFRALGPRRTRLWAQIVAAVIGAGFAIAMQMAAILAYGTPSRLVFLQSAAVLRSAPDAGSVLWWPARAARGDGLAFAAVLGGGGLMLAAAIGAFSPRCGRLALAAASAAHRPARRRRRPAGFRRTSPRKALRGKEWVLLRRDPWLASQCLMQLFYLLPPALLLQHGFYERSGGSALLVPILIMAAGQLAGGLTWLAVCGEDAPDLVASAPVTGACVLRAKGEAVAGMLAVVFGPFILGLSVRSPGSALVTAFGVGAAAASAAAIQFWFRIQAKRSQLRRRQTSSRIATFAEALSSCSWAGAGALAAAGSWLAVIPGLCAVAVLAAAWAIRPQRR